MNLDQPYLTYLIKQWKIQGYWILDHHWHQPSDTSATKSHWMARLISQMKDARENRALGMGPLKQHTTGPMDAGHELSI